MSNYFLTTDECSRHNIFPGVDILTAAGDQMMISVVEIDSGGVVESHSHPHEQMGLLLEGELEFTIGGETRRVLPGGIWRIPGGVEHGCRAVGGPVKAIDFFHPVRDDYR